MSRSFRKPKGVKAGTQPPAWWQEKQAKRQERVERNERIRLNREIEKFLEKQNDLS